MPGDPEEGGCQPTFPDGYSSLLLRYDMATGEGTVFAQPEAKDGPAPSLASIQHGPDGLLYVGDFSRNVLRVYDPESGKELRQIPTYGPSLCDASLSEPYTGYFVFTETADILVAMGAQEDGENGSVLRLAEDSRDLGCLVTPTTDLRRPEGVALLP